MVQQEDKNIAVFAHYDRHNMIDDYVLLYLKNLKKFCDKIIFVSDGNLSDQEQQKLASIVSNVIAQKHGEYDFGSWKRGFNLLKEKYYQEFLSSDKIIFANDSCYCIGEFDSIFDQIDKMPDVDCFGITDSTEHGYHLQSYFMVFRPTIFLENFFNEFLQDIKQQRRSNIVKKYEVGLSKLLTQNNKKLYAIFGKEFIQNYANKNKKLITYKIIKTIDWYQRIFGLRRIYKTIFKISDCYVYHNAFYLLILSDCPLLKRTIILKNFLSKKFFNTSSLCYFWRKIIDEEIDFDSKIILNHASRISQ